MDREKTLELYNLKSWIILGKYSSTRIIKGQAHSSAQEYIFLTFSFIKFFTLINIFTIFNKYYFNMFFLSKFFIPETI